MYDSTRLNSHQHRRRRGRRHLWWCCSFSDSNQPLSPENPTNTAVSSCHSLRSYSYSYSYSYSSFKRTEIPSNSPQKLPLARRIMSPGRVSPISENTLLSRVAPENETLPKPPVPADSEISAAEEVNSRDFDVRLNLKGKNGASLILELGSEVLTNNSSIFADLIIDYRKNMSRGLCRIEVPDVENLNVFHETIELMFEEDIQKKLLKIGVFRAINILEVSAGIKFTRGVSSCLKYLAAVPWTEEEEEKLRSLLNKLNFEEIKTPEILDRLYSLGSVDSQQTLTKQLIWSVTTCTDANARNELKSLVKGLLCESSVYEKDSPDLNKEDIFAVCESCLGSLICLLEESSCIDGGRKLIKKDKDKPLLECIVKQVDSINWLLDILLDHQMAEEFVDMWTNQGELLKMHENAAPMVRYELSRVSAMLFIAMGARKLQCRLESRLGMIRVWFRPMLSDFGWLQRCRKGLDMKALEEAMGQALLTLPLKEQYALFMDWFACFSKHGKECPNLSKAFQIWWRRSLLRGSEIFANDSR